MILVTGATGNSGQAVVKKLTRQGVPVRALVRDEAKAQPLTELPGASVVVGDMMRPQSLRAALDGISKALLISTARRPCAESMSRLTLSRTSRRVGSCEISTTYIFNLMTSLKVGDCAYSGG
jgi:uncharacterized protein YbjT (DUF2867 family)